MKKNPKVTAQTRENLLEAFWSLYRQKKIEYITIKEITSKAGYNRSTFYEYFVDIYDVLNQLEDSLLGDLKEKVLDSLEDGLNQDVIQKLADMYESKGEYLGVLLGESGDPYFAKKMKTVLRSALMNVFGLPENDIRASYIFEFGMSGIIGAITHWYHSNKNLPSSEIVRLIRSMLTTGIASEIHKYSNRAPKLIGR